MYSVLYDVSYVGLGYTKMGYYLPFYCWREVTFEGQSASIQNKHFFFFFAPEKISRVNIKEPKLMGFPEDSEQK